MSVFLTILRKGRNILLSKCFLFLRRAGVGGIEAGVGIFGEIFVFHPNVLVIALMGRLFLGAGEDGV